jgi:ATP-dependent RNA helicase DDX50
MGVYFDVPTMESERLQTDWHDSDWILSGPAIRPEIRKYYNENIACSPRQRREWSGSRLDHLGQSGG